MARISPDQRRNIVFIGHVSVGKTALAESILFQAGATSRVGKSSEGSSHFDFEPEEIKRGSSLAASVFDFTKDSTHYSLIDTPGSSSFIADTIGAVRGADAAVLVVGGSSGLKVQGEKGWNAACKEGIARAVFVNELDKENSSVESALEILNSNLGVKPIVMQLPIGSEASLSGIVDILAGRAYMTDEIGKTTASDIPADMQGAVDEAYAALVEAVAENDEELLDAYLENGELTREQVIAGFKKAFAAGGIIPLYCGSAEKGIGVQAFLEALRDYFPTPLERAPYFTLNEDGEKSEVIIADDKPLCGIVFKTCTDPFAGQISLVRIISGVMSNDDHVMNMRAESEERVGKLHKQLGKDHKPMDEAVCGQIVALAKLKDTRTGDTLCNMEQTTQITPLELPEPCINFSIEPKTRGDEEKILSSIEKISLEDPSIEVHRDAQTHETIIAGMGQNHVEITLEKLKRKFGVEVVLHPPKVPYRETIKGNAEAQGRHKKQSGGRGQFGDCWLRIKPMTRGTGFQFNNKIFGGAIPKNYIPAVEKGVVEQMGKGYLAGYPIVDIDCTVYDGSYHSVDSSDMAFKIAASKGFKAAMEKASPILLEPIMHLEITAPDDSTGDVIGDLNSRRGKVHDMVPKGNQQVIKADVPLAEMLTYAPTLRSMTGDRGSFHMEFAHYEEVPAHITQKVIQDSQVELAEAV